MVIGHESAGYATISHPVSVLTLLLDYTTQLLKPLDLLLCIVHTLMLPHMLKASATCSTPPHQLTKAVVTHNTTHASAQM